MKDSLDIKIDKFFSSESFGVIGASSNRSKYGNKVLRVYLQNHKKVFAVNPHEQMIEGVKSFSALSDLPDEVQSVSIITPPPITEKVVAEAIKKGIKNIWMQPGAESQAAIKLAESNGLNVIANGPCVLVTLGFHETVI